MLRAALAKLMKLVIKNVCPTGPDIMGLITTLTARIDAMTGELDTLITRVSEIETVADSAIELINSIKAQLDEAIAANDPAALADLSARLGTQTQELADAILANTDVPEEPVA